VPHGRGVVTGLDVRRLLEGAAEQRRESRRPQPRDDVGAGARVVVGATQAPAHVGCRERPDVALEGRGDESLGLGGDARRQHDETRGEREKYLAAFPQKRQPAV